MKIGVLGTGAVGETIASALTDKENLVMLGSRTATNEKAEQWVQKAGNYALQGTFADAAQFGDLLFLCLNGEHALEVVRSLPEESLRNKILIDVTNPLDFTNGIPPRILEGLGNHTSLGQEIQKALPNTYVVKALNTINHKLMVDARLVNNAEHNLFICGDDADAKNKVKEFLSQNFHWKANHITDLGGIDRARLMEAYVPFWVAIWQSVGTPMFNVCIVQ